MHLLLLLGCVDYGVKGTDREPFFDENDTAVPVDTDTELDTAADDTSTTEPPSCPEQSFPAEALAPLDECGSAPTVGSFTPTTEWTWETFAVAPTSENVMMTPVVLSLSDDDGDGDADADDLPDIAFVTYVGTDWTGEGVLRVVSGDGTASLVDVTGERIDGCSGIAGGDLDNDGWTDLVVVTTDKKVKAFEADGTLKWTSSAYPANLAAYSSAPAIADMDGDGSPEVIVGSLILNADGSLRGAGGRGIGSPGTYGTTSFAVDLDGDGVQEVVTGNAAYDPDGGELWYNGEADGYVAAADFDGDGVGEIVVSASAMVRLQDKDGNVLWAESIPGATFGYGGPPTVADFDADGAPEIGVAANSTYTVFDSDGAVLWQVRTQDGSSGVTGSSVFDFEGDGEAEAIYADETRLWAFAGPDGSVKLESSDHSNWTVIEYPAIADVDADGEAEIVVPNGLHPSYSGGARAGIAVVGDADNSWRAGRRIWNQYAYSITNIDDDGGVPATPTPNWESYNNFRSGDLAAASGGALPDLVAQIEDVCLSFCDAGRYLVWARVGNRGLTDVEGDVTLALWGDTATGSAWLAETTITGGIPAGELGASVEFDVFGVDPTTLTGLTIKVDGGNADAGDHEECEEEDDEDTWVDVFCAP